MPVTEGNKSILQGRFFYACKKQQRYEKCRFFQWADEAQNKESGNNIASEMCLADSQRIKTYLKGQEAKR